MDFALQFFVGIAALMLTILSVMSMFSPRKMIENFAVEPSGVAGLSTVRSVICGLFLGSVALLLVGLLTGQMFGLISVAVLMVPSRPVGLSTFLPMDLTRPSSRPWWSSSSSRQFFGCLFQTANLKALDHASARLSGA